MGATREPVGEGTVSFARPELLVIAVIGPLLVAAAFWLFTTRRRLVARELADRELLDRLGGGDLERFPILRFALVAGAAFAMGIAVAGPRWGMRLVEGTSSSRSVVLAVDVSKSMLATDVRPNRLERERLFVRRLLREMAGDRIGLVVFAGRAYVLSPLTIDHGALNLYVDALDPGIVSQGGSSLASALIQATDLARGPTETAGDRAVILISDGEALDERAAVEDAAERAARAGVAVHTVAVGTETGAPVPDIDSNGRNIGYKRDEAGDIVVSRMQPDLMEDIARRTGGRAVELDASNSTSRLLAAMGGMARVQTADGRRVEPKQREAIFIALALLLLLLELLVEKRAAMPAGPRRRVAGTVPAPVNAAALLLLLFVTTAAGIGDRERGNRLYREGRYAEAVEAYEAALRGGDASPELHYNLGTALLRLGRFEDAEQRFRAALDAVDPELRERTFYNMGNRFLEAARTEQLPQSQGPLLESAIDAYMRALRLDPTDAQAKWNLEMALRDQEQQSSGGSSEPQESQPQPDEGEGEGEGGGGGASQQMGPNRGERTREGSVRPPLTRDEAQRILNAVEQDERDLTRDKLRKGQRRTPVRRDW